MASIKHNTKGLDRLEKTIAKLASMEVAGGIFNDAGRHESGFHKATLLAMHELSDGKHYPKRPILGISSADFSEKWGLYASKLISRRIMSTSNKKALTYPAIKDTLEDVTGVMTSDIKSVFGSSKLVANAPSTIRKKGRNDPMVDTGELWASVDSKVRRKT